MIKFASKLFFYVFTVSPTILFEKNFAQILIIIVLMNLKLLRKKISKQKKTYFYASSKRCTSLY